MNQSSLPSFWEALRIKEIIGLMEELDATFLWESVSSLLW